MLQIADQIVELLTTNGKGKKAQVGYDLTLKSVNKITGGAVTTQATVVAPYEEVLPILTENNKIMYNLSPGSYSLTFEQGVKLPENKTAFIRHRSSILRCGGIITSGVYDPGYEVDEMGGVLIAQQPISIEKGARVAQIIMLENETAELYDGQWQKDKDLK